MARSKKGLPALSKLGLAFFDDSDCRKFMSLIDLRGASEEVYSFADRIQAGMVVNAIMTIQGIYESVQKTVSGDEDEKFSVDDYNKLVNSLNRAIASINTSLNHLGLTGKDRKEPPKADALAVYLQTVHNEDEIPPILQEAYISAQKERERLSGDRGDIAANDEDAILVDELRKPLQAFTEDEQMEDVKGDEIDVEVDKVVELR